MNSKEKAIIYPYSFEFAPIVRHNRLMKDYEIINAVAPSGLIKDSKDAAQADKGYETGILATDNYSKSLDDCETVIIADYNANKLFKGKIYQRIFEAISKHKNIVCTIKLDNAVIEEINKTCQKSKTYFSYYGNTIDTNLHINSGSKEIIEEIDVPIIFIAGLSERTNKFEIQLSMREMFINAGYKVTQIGSRHYCELFGFHSFPDFMLNCGIPESTKVAMFNHYIMGIKKKEMPDVIIIGIPGGIMPFNKQFTNRFGILAYEVSQAIAPDFSIISVLYDSYNANYFNMLSTSIKYKLGFEVSCFNVSNVQFDWSMSLLGNRSQYNVYDSSFIDEKIRSFNKLNGELS